LQQQGPHQVPPAAPEIRERALAGFVLSGLALIGALLMGRFEPQRGVYVLVISVLFAATAIWLGIAAGRQARRDRTMKPRTVTPSLIFGWIALIIGVLWAIALALFWSPLTTYSHCMDNANTVSATQDCQNQLSNSIGNELSLFRGN
jgi:hypothetical protein